MQDIFKKLSAPFPADRVSWRIGSMTKDKTRAMALAYIDARDVMERLDEVVGPENWQNRYPHANGKTVCEIGIRIGDEWVWKSDGAGDSDVEKEKGAMSDAFKRAAVRFGIGRYLYDIESPWVAVENNRIKESELSKLKDILSGKKSAKITEPILKPIIWPVDNSNPAAWKESVSIFVDHLSNAKALPDIEHLLDDNRDFIDLIPSEKLASWLSNQIIKIQSNFKETV